jgi:NADPH2:quinone reductase
MIVRALDGPAALERVDLPDPEPGAGDVLVDVRACGCNFGDLLITEGKYQLKPEPPFSPGSEVCGVVRGVGAGVSGIAPGQRVFAVLRWGGYASAVVAPAPLVVEIPAAMTFVQGAAFGVAYQTAHLALVDRARLQPGETLVVHGAAGGVGLAAVEVGAALGARVIATARGAEKLDLARQHGADVACDSDDDWPEAVRTATGGAGADVIYDPIGGDTFDRSTRVLAFGGRLLVIGFASGTIPSMKMNRVLLKNIAVVGLNWGAYRDEHPELLAAATRELFALHAAGRIRPLVSSTLPLVEAARALAELAARRTTGKVILLP